jgi:peroxiredoxin
MRGLVPAGRTLLAGALTALVLAGCFERGSGPARVGDPVPAFEGKLLDGTQVSLPELRGEPLLVNLWATWCAPCRIETPFLQSVHQDFGDRGLRVVGISVDAAGQERAIRSFLSEYSVTYEIVHDPAMESMDAFSAFGLPATYVIDREGVIRFARLGPVDESDRGFLEVLRAVVN